MSELKKDSVERTLYIPLTARICVSGHFPEYFRDDKAVSLKILSFFSE